MVYNIPVSRDSFEENIPPEEHLDDGTTQGKNDFKKTGYGGPCPPGGTHRYYFRIYALDIETDFPPGLTMQQLLGKIEGHIIDEGSLMGTYSRSR